MADQNVTGHHPILGGESGGKIVGVEHLRVGRELIVALPHQNPHPVGTGHSEFVAGIAVLHAHTAQLLGSGLELFQSGAEGEGSTG